MKRLIATLLLLAGVAAPAAAQMPGGGLGGTGPSMNLFNDGFHLKTDEEIKEQQERERAYKSGMSKIPDQKAKNDPWGAVRSTPPAAAPPTASNQRPPAK